jgi:hypothetical protein
MPNIQIPTPLSLTHRGVVDESFVQDLLNTFAMVFPNVQVFQELSSVVDGVVAHVGGGQQQPGVIPGPSIAGKAMIRVATVTSGNDSITLPPSVAGMQITVTNAAAANSLNVFPSPLGTTTEAINALGANAAFALTAGKTTTFCCYSPGLWHTLPLLP